MTMAGNYSRAIKSATRRMGMARTYEGEESAVAAECAAIDEAYSDGDVQYDIEWDGRRVDIIAYSDGSRLACGDAQGRGVRDCFVLRGVEQRG